MKTLAFLFVNVEPGSEERTAEAVRKVGGILEAYRIYGSFDIIAKVELEDVADLKKVVTQVRSIPSVRNTVTSLSSSKSFKV